MPIEFYCTQCYAQVITPDETAGKKGRCPHCTAVVQIPLAPAAPPAQATPVHRSVPVAPRPAAPTSPAQPSKGADPFKPTHQKTSEQQEALDRQFGFDRFDNKPEEGVWGESSDLSYKVHKTLAKERAMKRLVGPAQTLITLAVINLIVVTLGIAALVIFVLVQTQRDVELSSYWITFWIITIAVVMMDSTMIFIGGNHMRLARSYSMAYTGAVFALLPLNLLFFVTIPFGVWAISTLNDPELAEGFKRQ